MRITQGTFSFLPDLTDTEVAAQVQYCLDNDWAVSIEYTDDPHPRNVYWEMYGKPMFDIRDAAAVMREIDECRRTFADLYVRVNGFDRRYGRSTTALSFIVNRPAQEPGFGLDRIEMQDRQQRYTIRSNRTHGPEDGRGA